MFRNLTPIPDLLNMCESIVKTDNIENTLNRKIPCSEHYF